MQYVSQKGQDRWVIEEIFPGRRSGYFLDLAACDGVADSNSLILERELGWTGVAIEAEPNWFAGLKHNRICEKVHACVDEVERDVEFLPNSGVGGIVADDTDNCPSIRAGLIEEYRANGKMIAVRTRTLADILDRVCAPPVIDYFSFDVEGAETRILRRFPFDRYRFLAVTIERPTPELNELMFANGYVFVKNFQFDSFYVHRTHAGCANLKLEPFEQIPPKDW
jgi:hypothetical protein